MRILNLCITSCILLLGCQKPIQSQNEQAPQQAAKKTTSQEKCQELDQIMQKIDNHSTIEALNQINAQLKQCIATVENAQQLKWLESSTQMYQRFFAEAGWSVNNNKFYDYTISILDNTDQADDAPIKLGDPALFKLLPARDQYLLKHQGEAYIKLQDVGEAIFEYHRQPQYIIDIFAPALPKDQQVFVQRMAKDNQDLLYSDAALTVSWAELVERALFWEQYLQQYPNAIFKADAQNLFHEYRYLIFFGSDNTPVSDLFFKDAWINEEALTEIKKLAKRQDTSLHIPAKKFLNFIQFSLDEHNQVMNISDSPYVHLQKFLDIKNPWDDHNGRDCHTDAVCLQYSVN
ncbi:hypothetical protein [Acinetobacter sp. NIPH 2699]|uniref:hypothetical protein n=1 Tax=Acinetobacter sp. NIPH 2699 TaxID=2923433 RepID=UPI001F4BA005|nr:hypothetical protein [Acinetobacter sp. NIPH 2699]MCH7335369.1 hypothetical protein [Acinetobacter sp. NIPH 2699]